MGSFNAIFPVLILVWFYCTLVVLGDAAGENAKAQKGDGPGRTIIELQPAVLEDPEIGG